ncbi:MAG: hypothetical protein N4A35_06510 [Flavobacteriales bacterium]|jgi:hypothetical protein|nr:hypothetical protein [Flavobacteriales bacterium]
MNRLNGLIGGVLFSSALIITSCGENTQKEALKNSPEYNMIASVQNPAAMLSLDVMDLLEKSNIKESHEVPAQFKMLLNTQIEQHFNSENQGFKVEGNIPLVVSATTDNKFNYLMSFTDVIDAEKTGSSLALYFNGHVEKNEAISTLSFTTPDSIMNGCFAWDTKKLVVVVSENQDNKALAEKALANRYVDAADNAKIKHFIAADNDFSSLVFMDTYTQMANEMSHTKVDEELSAAYQGMTMTGAGNFNNGSFLFESNLDAETFVKSGFNNLNDQGLNTEYNNFISDNGKAIAFGGVSLNLDAVVKAMNHTHTEYGNYDEELAKMGIKKEDLNQVFDGNFSLSLMEIESVPSPGYENNPAFNEERPKFLLTCGLKDTERIKTILESNEAVKPVENYFLVDDTYIGIHENKLFVSLSDTLIQNLSKGEQLAAFNTSFKSPVYGKLITDMNQLPINYKTMLLNGGGEEVLKFYNEIETIEFTGDIHQMTFKVELKDSSKNTLELFSNSVIKNVLPLVMNNMF